MYSKIILSSYPTSLYLFLGYSCPQQGLTEGKKFNCREGHYCPSGTKEENQYPCLPGTYSGETNLQTVDDCLLCPERFYCVEGTGVNLNPMQPCKPGYFCPKGTPVGNRNPCPPGTYSNSSSLASSAECQDCPPGSYCYGEGESSPSGICPPGYFCPSKTRFPSQYPCEKGTFNPDYGKEKAADCLDCFKGKFCEAGKPQPEDCPSGTYMPNGVDPKTNILEGTTAKSVNECLDCPGGTQCDEGTIIPTPCGMGKYSKEGEGFCRLCMKGHFCSNATTSKVDMVSIMQCPAGLLCKEGLKSPSEASPCPAGHFCPKGIKDAKPCMVGTFNPNTKGQGPMDCGPCLEGSYCTEANINPAGVCDEGYYCPSPFTNPFASKDEFPEIGSYGPMQIPCPEGTFVSHSGAKKLESCLSCPAGQYCSSGTSKPIICPKGSFCPANSSEPTPCNPGTYGHQAGLVHKNDCKKCPKGHYCDSPGLSGPRGQCDPGYLCYEGSDSAAPVDGIKGIICPIGGYCPIGSLEATPCPMGTYSNAKGAVNAADCIDCDPGFYCSEINGGNKTGQCWGGYYCPGRSHTPMQNETEPGYFSKNGSRTQDPCPIGKYQPQSGQSFCLDCEAGYYCDEEKMTAMKLCPAGHFCKRSSASPEPCPRGSYSNATGRTELESCLMCPKGKFCQDIKLTQPTDDCEAGFFCWGGAQSPEPVFNNDSSTGQEIVLYGDQCYSGHYCPKGTTQMQPCGLGTYNPVKGARDISACLPCPVGKYCNDTGLSTWTGSCDAGYFCDEGASQPDPPKSLCPLHYFCPEGTEAPQLCSKGKHVDKIGAIQCQWCPKGHYCDPGKKIHICPAGHYCPESTPDSPISSEVLPQYVCEKGSFNPYEGMSSPNNCTDCPGGMFCNERGLSNPSGKISPGYYSRYGASVAEPVEEFAEEGTRGVCPKGFFCQEGAELPKPCPEGTYGVDEGYKEITDCQPSCPGFYINTQGTTSLTGIATYPDYCPGNACSAGYWCNNQHPGSGVVGSNIPNPVGRKFGDICPPGFYCPAKSKRPIGCKAGTYTDESGQPLCKQCPSGFYCTKECKKPILCPPGYYCPPSTEHATQFPCSSGTFINITGSSSQNECKECLPGYYCLDGTSYPEIPCNEGFYCPPGSSSPSNKCPVGSYCPIQSSSPKLCDAGKFCDTESLSQPTGNCSKGYFCILGAKSFQPNKQPDNSSGPCPVGHYCPLGTINGQACPPGTYQPLERAESPDDCKLCDAGYYCEGHGNEKPTGPCQPGYFCPEGQKVSNPIDNICPVGYFCTEGTMEAMLCQNGTYQNEIGQAVCKICPAGFVCNTEQKPSTYFNETICPKGHYCPPGCLIPVPCPYGTYNSHEGRGDVLECLECPGGYICDEMGLGIYSKPCPKGYFCIRGAGTDIDKANSSANFGVCPSGHYCPMSTVYPLKCPTGTFANQTMLMNESQCTMCPAGLYCEKAGLAHPSGPCHEGFYCEEGSDSETNTICSKGHFCPKGSAQPLPCPLGTLNSEFGASNISSCLLCPGGTYCGETGLSKVPCH